MFGSVFVFLTSPRPPISTLFPYTTLFRSNAFSAPLLLYLDMLPPARIFPVDCRATALTAPVPVSKERFSRSEEHTSELQSRRDLVCRLLLEKKKSGAVFGAATSSHVAIRS